MLFVQVVVVVIKKIVSEIERDNIIACGGCHAPELIAATKFKTTKINFGALFGLSTKINAHENCPLYGIHQSSDRYNIIYIVSSSLCMHAYPIQLAILSRTFVNYSFNFLCSKIHIH